MSPLNRPLFRYSLCAAVSLALGLLLELRGWSLLFGILAASLIFYSGKALFAFVGRILEQTWNSVFLCLLFKSCLGFIAVLFVFVPALMIALVGGVLFGAYKLIRDFWPSS